MDVEIWSDIACPWCYVGKRRFEAALAAYEHRDDVRVTWRSFQLDPQAPRERGVEASQHLADKYGRTLDQAREMHAQMTAVAAEEGLDFHFERLRGGNTFDAHRLVHLAAEHGMQDAMKERLMRAYLTEGEPIGDPAALAHLAVEAGLPEDEVKELLAGDRFADAVRGDENLAAAFGISAVPCFVVDRAVAVSGAQSPEILGELLAQGWARQVPVVVAEGEACGPGGC